MHTVAPSGGTVEARTEPWKHPAAYAGLNGWICGLFSQPEAVLSPACMVAQSLPLRFPDVTLMGSERAWGLTVQVRLSVWVMVSVRVSTVSDSVSVWVMVSAAVVMVSVQVMVLVRRCSLCSDGV